MSIVTELNLLRRDCKMRGVEGPHTYAITSNDLNPYSAELTMLLRATGHPDVTQVQVMRAIAGGSFVYLNCRVILGQVMPK